MAPIRLGHSGAAFATAAVQLPDGDELMTGLALAKRFHCYTTCCLILLRWGVLCLSW
jgi:hypothetical protein